MNLFFVGVAFLITFLSMSAHAKANTEVISMQQMTSHALRFDEKLFVPKTLLFNGKEVKYRAYENIVYVQKPVDTKYQKMHIYIPEAYFSDKNVGMYNARNAPIFFPNGIGGYMPSEAKVLNDAETVSFPDSVTLNHNSSAPPSKRLNAAIVALAHGYVVAIPGARGRSIQDGRGDYVGKAPAALVDLKAAVRYLRFNDKAMPGDAEKIISNGTSAGGAMSALLGASGNSGDFLPYLKALGAAETRDDIYAVSSYCPITLLEYADAAYEWQFSGVNTYKKMIMGLMIDYHKERKEVSGNLSEGEIKISSLLKTSFPDVVNNLKLTDAHDQPLTLDQSGDGSFKALIQQRLIASAQKALDAGANVSAYDWVSVRNGKVTHLDFNGYVHAINRMKTPPAFDALDLSSGENDLFGAQNIKARHFTQFGLAHSVAKGALAEDPVVKAMNPLTYIGATQVKTAKFWRIRHGSVDRDTSLAVSTILATRLQNVGQTVDLAFPWGVPHSGDYDLSELLDWMAKVSQ